jgi:preprotein translocase SecE subunit
VFIHFTGKQNSAIERYKENLSMADGSRFRFIGDIIAELKKVVWLSRREAIYLTILVMIISIAAGVILGAFDYGFSQLFNKVFFAG